MKSNIKSYKNLLGSHIKGARNDLNNFESALNIEFSDKAVRESINNINDSVNEGINNIDKEIQGLSGDLEWNNLNIAFFGETNGGKSTLIEALIKGNGSSIGDGRKDYTQKVTSIKYDDITLLDLPGMEGNEEKYIKEIKKGINKAHVVFYVINSSKEPEEPTIKKIRNFLKDQTNVYLILNVRGQPSKHAVVQGLKSPNVEIVEKRAIEKFQRILGSHYKGSIVLNANFAFLTVGKKVESRFKNAQNKLQQIFESSEQALNFSEVNKMETLIYKLKNDKPYEIIISNTYKYINLMESIIQDILRSKKDFDGQLKKVVKIVESANVKSKNEIDKFENRVYKIGHSKLQELKVEVQNLAKYTIENDNSEKYFKTQVEELSGKSQKSIESAINDYVEIMNREIARIYKDLENQIDTNFRFAKYDNSMFSVKGILINIKFGINGFLKELGNLILAASGFLAGPAIGVITISSHILNRLFVNFFIGKQKRKEKSIEATLQNLDQEIDEIQRKYKQETIQSIRKLNNNFFKEETRIRYYFDNLQKLSFIMTEQIQTLISRKNIISNNLIRFIENQEYEYVYLDLNMSRLLLIGGSGITDHDHYNLKEVDHYKDIEELIQFYSNRIRNGYLYLKPYEEFQKRALSNLIGQFRRNGYDIKGVRRENIEFK